MSEYRYVERETYGGEQYRTGGCTEVSRKSMKHLRKVGKIEFVKGYVYKGRYGAYHVGVMVRGDKGYIRFGGFCWGYSGEGPRGLAELFSMLEISIDPTTKILGSSPDCSADAKGTHWKILLGGFDKYAVKAVAREKEEAIQKRLEYLRREIQAERISLDEILELESLASHIDDGDVLLLEWAGVPETTADGSYCTA